MWGMAFCAKCGAQLNAGSGFCAACGTAVSSQSVTPSGAAAAPAQSSAGAPSAGMTN
ncbi:MAG TPA: zinc-ribbon domain-containing protein, partial [Candidatus Angelobacter sp.]